MRNSFRRFVPWVLIAAFAGCVCVPARNAAAADVAAWRWPCGSPAPVLVSFGVAYSENGVSRVHHGVDIAAPSGSEVVACEAGTVVFVGRVPADGGGTALAVTVRDGEGRRVTYLPLTATNVSCNEPVPTGAALGQLAGEGDRSADASHLHLGVRSGEAYMDPAQFLPEAGAKLPASAPGGGGSPSRLPRSPNAPASTPKPAPSSAPPVSVLAPAAAAAQVVVPGSVAGVRAAAPTGVRAAQPAAAPHTVTQSRAAPAPEARTPLGLRDIANRFAGLRARVQRAILFAMGALLAGALLRPVWRRAAEPRCVPAVMRARE